MRIIANIMVAIALLVAGAAIGFPAGRDLGFKIGSEWALVQADLVAEEAGVFMPVQLQNDRFVVVLKQPPGLYRNAWRLADQFDERTGVKHAEESPKGADASGSSTVRQTEAAAPTPAGQDLFLAFSDIRNRF